MLERLLLGLLKNLGTIKFELNSSLVLILLFFFSKVDQELLPKIMHSLQLLLGDTSIAVQKRVIQALTQLYKVTLLWLSKANSVSELMEKTWNMLCQMKAQIAKMIDHDNDG